MLILVVKHVLTVVLECFVLVRLNLNLDQVNSFVFTTKSLVATFYVFIMEVLVMLSS